MSKNKKTNNTLTNYFQSKKDDSSGLQTQKISVPAKTISESFYEDCLR